MIGYSQNEVSTILSIRQLLIVQNFNKLGQNLDCHEFCTDYSKSRDSSNSSKRIFMAAEVWVSFKSEWYTVNNSRDVKQYVN